MELVPRADCRQKFPLEMTSQFGRNITGAPNDSFRKNICSEDDLRSRIFETFVVKFLACLPLLGFSNIQKMAYLPIFNGFLL